MREPQKPNQSPQANTGEIECFLVVPRGTPNAGVPVIASKPPELPQAPSFGETAVAAHAVKRAEFEAAKQARYSANHGAGLSARLDEITKQYMALTPGSKERQAYFAEHHNELWQAQRR